MRQSVRLVVNVCVMFGRIGLTFGVGLYSTRVLVNQLGHSDFGLLAALGATGSLVLFLGYALSTGAQRTLAHEIGRGDEERLAEVFNSTLLLFALLGLGLLAVGLTLRPIVLDALEIPTGREQAAGLTYVFSLLFLATTTISSPYHSALEARQAMGQVAAFEVLRSLLNLAAVLLLYLVPWDRMASYAALLLLAGMIRVAGVTSVCMWRFPETRPRLSGIRRGELGRIARFAGWATLLGMGAPLFSQASTLVLGIAISPAVVAAYAIATRVGAYHVNFAGVVPRVVQPAMTTLEARGARGDVRRLVLMTGKYATLAALFPVVPLLLETDMILTVWLRSVPEGSPLFVRLVIAGLTLRTLSAGYDRAVYSHGEIGVYAIATTGLWLLALCCATFGLFVLDAPAWIVPGAFLGMAIANTPLRVLLAGRLIDLPWTAWVRETVLPTLVPAGLGVAAALGVRSVMAPGWERIVALIATYAVVAAPGIWLFAVGAPERKALGEVRARFLGRSLRAAAHAEAGRGPDA